MLMLLLTVITSFIVNNKTICKSYKCLEAVINQVNNLQKRQNQASFTIFSPVNSMGPY